MSGRTIGEDVVVMPMERAQGAFFRCGKTMITIRTQRFGIVNRPTEEVLTFPGGIFGFELQLRWLLLGDREHGGLYWLQNVEQSDLSLSMVDPREFLPDYSLHLKRGQLNSIWNGTEQLVVLSVLTEYDGELCLNLRNPVVINPATRIGRQVVTTDSRSPQHVLASQSLPLRKSA